MISQALRDRVRLGHGTSTDAEAILNEYERLELDKLAERPGFRAEIAHIINKYSKENDSDTPDYALAEYVDNALFAFNVAVNAREVWYERSKTNPQIDWKVATKDKED